MTKTAIKNEIKGVINSSKEVFGVKVACVYWKNNPWMVIENEETFEDAKKDDFVPITSFNTQKELVDAIYNTQ